MKLKHIFLIFMLSAFSTNAEAQFLKKLKQKAEEVFMGKTDKSQDSIFKNDTSKTMDSTEVNKRARGILDIMLSQTPKDVGGGKDNNDMTAMGKPIPPPLDNNVKLPESYKFSYQATIQVKSNKGTEQAEYLIEPNETYYAKKQKDKNYEEHVVYDNERSVEVHYAEVQGQKRHARKKMDIFTKAKIVGAYKDAPNREVKPTGEKKLLGFNCKGYEIKTDAGTTQIWVTNEAPATLYAAMFEKRAEAANSPFTKNTMIMEVNFTSNETADKSYQMLCTQLQPKTIVFNLNDYKE
ncbi:MAG: DUF4412 domain-containing protein [Flavobacteriaceae bacterium]